MDADQAFEANAAEENQAYSEEDGHDAHQINAEADVGQIEVQFEDTEVEPASVKEGGDHTEGVVEQNENEIGDPIIGLDKMGLAENKEEGDEMTEDTAAAPNISSYFSQAPEDDPFGTIAPDSKNVSHKGLSLQLDLAKEDRLQLKDADEERLYSPPVTKDEMTSDDLQSVHELTVDLSKASQAEVNRMYDAWIPSDSTRSFLVQSLAAGGKIFLPADKVLKPRLAMADTQADAVYQETFKLRGEAETQKRQVLNLSKVDHTIAGLEQLICAECWRSALDLTAILLTNMSQGLQAAAVSADSIITEQSMKVWAVRIALLTKLKLYSIAEAECQQFSHMDSPELHFEFHHKLYPGRTGSMVPFSLRLLNACLPQFLGRHNESLDRLFYIKGQVNKILHHLQNGECEDGRATVISEASRKASITLWHQRELQVLYSLTVCLTDMKDFRLAINIYKELLVRDPENSCFTYSTMARLCLQMGAFQAAESYFTQALECCKGESEKQRMASLHSGYLNICAGNYTQAPAMFGQASSTLHPICLAKNNSAVSMLYNGQLKGGIVLLEELIHSDPEKYLQDTVAMNLCTLYELESSVDVSKKQNLLMLANQHKGNGFNINCLKMSLG